MFIPALICLFSFTLAALFSIVTMAVYGVESIADLAWIDSLFWALAATGPAWLAIASIRDWFLYRRDPHHATKLAQNTSRSKIRSSAY